MQRTPPKGRKAAKTPRKASPKAKKPRKAREPLTYPLFDDDVPPPSIALRPTDRPGVFLNYAGYEVDEFGRNPALAAFVQRQKEKAQAKAQNLRTVIEAPEGEKLSPKQFLGGVVNDVELPVGVRLEAAKALAPFVHTRGVADGEVAASFTQQDVEKLLTYLSPAARDKVREALEIIQEAIDAMRAQAAHEIPDDTEPPAVRLRS